MGALCKMSPTATVNSAMAKLALAQRCDDRFSEQTPFDARRNGGFCRTRKSVWQVRNSSWQQKRQRVSVAHRREHGLRQRGDDHRAYFAGPNYVIGKIQHCARKLMRPSAAEFGQIIRPCVPSLPRRRSGRSVPLFLEMPTNARSIVLGSGPLTPLYRPYGPSLRTLFTSPL
jgi:hypothetical protein